MIDQIIGKDLPSTLTGNISGNPISLASQVPNNAPMNPKAIETRMPPRPLPAMACPKAPHTPAINNKINNANQELNRRRKQQTVNLP